jgi:hypothetical protein
VKIASTMSCSGEEEEKMQEILDLVTACASGNATSEDVEAAVSKVLGKPHTSTTPTVAPVLTNSVERDTGDYDNEEDDDEKEEERDEDEKVASKKHTPWWDDTKWSALYSEIPLGSQGARMVTTFGGNPKDPTPPPPATVQAVLQGARRMLQVAIQDARHVRRKRQKVYNDAQAVLKAVGRKKKLETAPRKDEWSPDVLYRVHNGYDKLAYHPKCGFDVEDLDQLYPEEMNAYTRWNACYKEANTEEEEPTTKKPDSRRASPETTAATAPPPAEMTGGHLQQRAAQFDIRTDEMKSDVYMEFSEVRKGSFLPRRKGDKTDYAAQQSSNENSWANLPVVAIRYLHWIGFDPDSPLPPPNEAVTHALAFLGYDFVGRIVEKAIDLRSSNNNHPGKQQLEPADIERALQDPDVKPVPLYSASNKKDAPGPQLYFGPGFEYRLEMELDELCHRHTKVEALSATELEVLQKEEELFRRLAEPPKANEDVMLLKDEIEEKDDDDDDDDDDGGGEEQRPRRKRQKKTMS